jgi:flavin-dependent dehydrogenase
MRDVVVVGGGVAGLTAAILLRRKDWDVVLIEKKDYPFHRVCGEYISNEIRIFMQREGLLPDIELPRIDEFELSSADGRSSTTRLEMGGFGISRYSLDHHLYQVAISEGVEVLKETALNIITKKKSFHVKTRSQVVKARVCIGAFGKRSNLDQVLDRPFFKKRSPYIGVKYHAKTNHPGDRISLHNFEGGYCGVSLVEDGVSNICYLGLRDHLKEFRDIGEMEKSVLFRNPRLKLLFESSEFLWDKPEVINEISFDLKQPVENHVLMCGDAAGMITPLCGNGMAMAIHAAKTLSGKVDMYLNKKMGQSELEMTYQMEWNSLFKWRLWYGRQVQRLFGNPTLSNLSVKLINNVKPLSTLMIRGTHGKEV